MSEVPAVDRTPLGTFRQMSDPILRQLTEQVTAQLPVLTERVTDEIVAQMRVYGSQTTVSRDDLTRSVSDNLQTLLGALSRPEVIDLSRASDTGSRRARQGVPLPEVLRAFRIGFSLLWDLMLDFASQSGEAQLRSLISATSAFWYLIDQYLEAVTVAYRESGAELVRAQRQRRGALLEALLSGGVVSDNAMWDVTQLLGLPTEGFFSVVAADASDFASAALTGVERILSEQRMASAWRLTPSFELGVVSLGVPERVDQLVSVLADRATVRIGVSPPYTDLGQTPRALHLAHIARASLPVGEVGAACFDDSPLAVLIGTSPDEAARIAQRVLGPILLLPQAERDLLISTAEAWINHGASTKLAGAALFCHPNTVRYRLQRIQSLLHIALTDPVQLAELVVAVRSWRLGSNTK